MLHYRRMYADRPDPIVFMSLMVFKRSEVFKHFDRLYVDFILLIFLSTHRESTTLSRELPSLISYVF